MMKVDEGVAVVRSLLAKESILPPPQWFEHTIKNGVCWLNTSLTFTSTDTAILAQHLQFWRPIVEGIISALIDAKRELVQTSNPNAGLVFVLWGGHAQKLRKMVEKLNTKKPSIDIQFIEAPHPAANGTTFHTVKSFNAIDDALAKLGLPAIDWLPKGSGSASSSADSGTAAPKAAKKTSATAGKKTTAAKKASAASKKRARDSDDDDASSEEEFAPKTKRAKK